MAESTTPAPAAAPMPVTVIMFERLELRVAQLEEELKDAKLQLARLKAAPPPAPEGTPAPARKRSGILRERE